MYREGLGIAWGRMRWSWPNKSSSWSLDSISRTRIESIICDPRDNHSQKCPVSKPSVCWENTASSPTFEGQEAEWRHGPSCVSTVRGSAHGLQINTSIHASPVPFVTHNRLNYLSRGIHVRRLPPKHRCKFPQKSSKLATAPFPKTLATAY